MASINDAEMAFSTERLLPDWSDVPAEFRNGNVYTRIAEAIFYGTKLPDGEVTFRDGFRDDEAASDLQRCVRAHLQSFGPKHEHKIAGVGYMIAHVCEVKEGAAKAA
ncbi:hypothetical protein DF039_36975 [Burkholderia cenocepacia]|nr:hypothetical protein DF039_36975 [Burkholderia cenocepacia]